jgi:hypothetical protein
MTGDHEGIDDNFISPSDLRIVTVAKSLIFSILFSEPARLSLNN